MEHNLLTMWLGALIVTSFVLSMYLILNSDSFKKYLEAHRIPVSTDVTIYYLIQTILISVDIITFIVFMILFLK